MQKKLIALAIAGLVSAPAFAQSNVTVYGIADAAIGIGSADDNDFRGVVGGVLSGNRLGFKGSEDLGNGLKAVFTLEYALSIDTNHGIGNNPSGPNTRQSFVGLQGAFGTVALGRQYAPGYFAGYDAALSASISPQSILTSGSGNLTITPNSPARWDNAVSYTNTFGGLTARAIYAARSAEDSARRGLTDSFASPARDDSWGGSLEYANGPLKAGVFYHFVKQPGSDAQKEWYLGGQYDFGAVTLAGSYQVGRDVSAANSTDDRDNKVWNVGVIVPVSAPGKVHVSYGALKEDDAKDADSKSWVLAYTHALSKRTTAYAAYNRTTNDDSVQNGMVAAPAAVRNAQNQIVIPAVKGEDSGLFAVGMRHAF